MSVCAQGSGAFVRALSGPSQTNSSVCLSLARRADTSSRCEEEKKGRVALVKR